MPLSSPYPLVYQENLNYLRSCLQLDEVLIYYLTEGCITQRSYEAIRRKLTNEGPTAACEVFVTESLLRDPDPEHFKTFIQLLESTNQVAVARRLKGSYRNIVGKELEYVSHEGRKPMSRRPREVKAVQAMDEQPTYVTPQGPGLEKMDLALAAAPPPIEFPPDLSIDMEPIKPGQLDMNRNDLLGRGNFGTVFKGNLNGKTVAIKELPIKIRKNLPIEIKNEIQISALVKHPNIVQFLGFAWNMAANDCCLLLVYEMINGKNLLDLIYSEELEKEYKIEDEAKRFQILLKIAEAIAYLHGQKNPIIHGDIKPANVMLKKNGIPKLCDLGLSKIKQDPNLTMSVRTTVHPKGTPLYMGPEQLLDSKTSSSKSDVYSFGALMFEVIFYECMWNLPHNAVDDLLKSMSEEKVPPMLQDRKDHRAYPTILKCVQYDYKDRPEVMEVVKELANICGVALNNDGSSIASMPFGIEPLKCEDIKIDRNKMLGRGAFGMVYRCEYLGAPVAVKELVIANRKTALPKNIINEIQVSASVRHPNVVNFLGYTGNTAGKNPCLLLLYELIDGENMEDIIYDDSLHNKYNFNNEATRYRILYQTAQAMAYLHGQKNRIIHGDIKPANVMLTTAGEAKLCDLGLSKIKQDANLTMSVMATAHTGGTPMYMAPEQLLDSKTSSSKSDVYSFGALMFEVFFGDHMWEMPNINGREVLLDSMKKEKISLKLRAKEDHRVYPIILKCVQYDYKERSEALAIVKELAKLCGVTL